MVDLGSYIARQVSDVSKGHAAVVLKRVSTKVARCSITYCLIIQGGEDASIHWQVPEFKGDRAHIIGMGLELLQPAICEHLAQGNGKCACGQTHSAFCWSAARTVSTAQATHVEILCTQHCGALVCERGARRTCRADAATARSAFGGMTAVRVRECAYCQTTSCDDTKCCGKCKRVNYCGVVCQRAHWSAHKADCKRACGGD
jgi:hypothetical protein